MEDIVLRSSSAVKLGIVLKQKCFCKTVKLQTFCQRNKIQPTPLNWIVKIIILQNSNKFLILSWSLVTPLQPRFLYLSLSASFHILKEILLQFLLVLVWIITSNDIIFQITKRSVLAPFMMKIKKVSTYFSLNYLVWWSVPAGVVEYVRGCARSE